MKTFTGWQYLLIDLANAFGKDKLRFEERIQWAEDHLAHLETLVDQAENKPMFYKALLAVRSAQAGQPTGHLVEFDGVCSGIQIMAALTGCVDGARATGMVDPDRRADAYTDLTNMMNDILRSQGIVVKTTRKDAKRALMTSFYGSREIPKELFGEDTPQINAFYQAAQAIAPGPWELLQDLVGSWQPYALEHAWTLPDGYEAKVKVLDKVSTRVEVDELDHATFTYEYHENTGSKKGLSNAAK